MFERVQQILVEMHKLTERMSNLRHEFTTLQGQCPHARQGVSTGDGVVRVVCQDCCLVLSQTKDKGEHHD
jgi:hypothetical protein